MHPQQEVPPSFPTHMRERKWKGSQICPGDSPIQQEIRHFFHEIKPLLVMYRLMGLLPFHINEAGDVVIKVSSPLMLYTVVLQAGMTACAFIVCKHRIDFIQSEKPDFSRLLIETTFIGAFVPMILSPFSQLPEVCKKACFLNDWIKFQKCYLSSGGKPLNTSLGACVKVMLVVSVLIAITITVFPFVTLDNMELWHSVPFFYSIYICILATVMWYINSWALVKAARILTADLEEIVVTKDYNCREMIAEYKVLWLQLSKVAQGQGTSSGFTYAAQLVAYFFEQVLAVYGILTNIQEGLVVTNLVCGASTVIFSTLIFVTCNSAQMISDEVGTNVQEKIQSLCHRIPLHCAEAKQEARLFVETIIENPPTINLAGFVAVNRGLQTSLISTMVTYLVVLIQFQMSTEAPGNSTFTEPPPTDTTRKS